MLLVEVMPRNHEGQMFYKGLSYVAQLADNSFMFRNELMHPAEFARRTGGTGRNARTSLTIKRPHDVEYVSTATLFEQEWSVRIVGY